MFKVRYFIQNVGDADELGLPTRAACKPDVDETVLGEDGKSYTIKKILHSKTNESGIEEPLLLIQIRKGATVMLKG